MLATFAEFGQAIPRDWENALKKLKATSQYQTIVEQFEPQLAQLEKDADEREATELLRKMPKVRLPN